MLLSQLVNLVNSVESHRAVDSLVEVVHVLDGRT